MKERRGQKIKVGISSCLLGEKVRFDGQHKKDNFILSLMNPHVKWVSMCPELESGLGVPREAIRLEGSRKKMRAVTVKSKVDVTEKLESYSIKKVSLISKMGLSGFILKKGSPSCGMERVKCYDKNMSPSAIAQGLFAKQLMNTFPLLPVEDEGRLKDDKLRENFIERVFAYDRLLALYENQWSLGKLVKFHSQHKIQLMAHSPVGYQKLGRLVANSKTKPKIKLQNEYGQLFMHSLTQPATKGRNCNALEHMAGYLKKHLEAVDRAEMGDIIQAYRKGWIPLIVPMTMMGHYVRRFKVNYLLNQTYLEPSPRELRLRNYA